MPSSVAFALLVLLLVYAVIGAAVACLFVARGVESIDPAARRAPLGFRLIIFPGALALWPGVVRAWISARRRHAVSASPAHPTAETSR